MVAARGLRSFSLVKTLQQLVCGPGRVLRLAHARAVDSTTTGIVGAAIQSKVGTSKSLPDLHGSGTAPERSSATVSLTSTDDATNVTCFSPKELLYASLSSCTLATVRAFIASSKQSSPTVWGGSTIDTMSSHVVEVMGGDEHMPLSISINLIISGTGITSSMRESLVRATKFCPVKRMLRSVEVNVNVQVVPPRMDIGMEED